MQTVGIIEVAKMDTFLSLAFMLKEAGKHARIYSINILIPFIERQESRNIQPSVPSMDL